MKAGIIAEGRGDLAVITNILKGVLDISRSDIGYILPEYDYDETDLAKMNASAFSSWTSVRKKCLDKSFLNNFFEVFDDNKFLVIHIDAAERFETYYEVLLPKKIKSDDYVSTVRENIKNKILEWTGAVYLNRMTFAIAVEETDAWIMTKFAVKNDETGHLVNVKERLKKELNQFYSVKERKKFFALKTFDQYYKLSEPFRKQKELERFQANNISLKLFCENLMQYKQ